MHITTRIILIISTLTISSCSNIIESVIDDAIGSTFKSRKDKNIDSDTKRLNKGEPLKHHSSEKRLRAAREKRLLDQLQHGD